MNLSAFTSFVLGSFVCLASFCGNLLAQTNPVEAVEKPHILVLPRCLVTVLEQVQVPARESGVLEFLEAKEGVLVQKGQVLGQMDRQRADLEKKAASAELQVAQKQAKNDINVKFAQAAHEVAQAELARSEEANAKAPGTITKAELEEKRLAVKKAGLQMEQSAFEQDLAQASVEGKQALLDLAEANVERRQIVAPLSGQVVERYRTAGEWLNPGEPVLRIMRLDRLRVEGFVNADQYGVELLHRLVSVAVLLPGERQETFSGKIIFVSPEVEPVTSRVRIWAEVDNPQLLLRPGVKASMTIQLSTDATP